MRCLARWWFPLLVVLGLACSGSVARADYEEDMVAFVQQVDAACPFLELKGITQDWERAKPELLQRARECTSDEEFLQIVIDAIRVLRDGHLGFVETKVELPPWPERYFPGLNLLPAADERVVVMYAPRHLAMLTTGTVVTKIDGVDARRFLEQRSAEAWEAGGFFSSPQRARMFEYRLALRGAQGQEHTIGYLNEGEEHSVTVACERTARGWPHTYNLPSDLKQVGRSFFYTKLADEVGYMVLRRVDPSIPEGIDEALRAHPKLRGWIVDMRGNGGGGYDRDLIDKIKRFPRPVAVLIDAGCISAGETLARDFRRYAGARLFGARSGGSSSSKKTWSFPSGLASIRFPVRTRWRSDGEPIEFNGIDPDVEVEAVPEELQAGHNSAIVRGQEYVIEATKEQRPKEGDSRDRIVGWYDLAWGTGALIPIFKLDGMYYTACRGFEIPLKECPGGLAWALTPSSLAGTTFEVALGSGPTAIRIVDRRRQDHQESYVPGQRQRITRVAKPAGLLDATAPPPKALDDFQGLYQPVWFPWFRWEIRKDGSRYLLGRQEYRGSEPPVVWRTQGELRELTPLTDKLGLAGLGADDPGQLTYSEARQRFEFVIMKTGARMPLARIVPSAEGDVAPPSVTIGIPAWH